MQEAVRIVVDTNPMREIARFCQKNASVRLSASPGKMAWTMEGWKIIVP
jgi:hypothetical protein